MALPLLRSKLFVPPTRPALVPRPRLLEKLNEGLDRKLTLISAPAGFGKTTVVSEWVAPPRAHPERPAAWLVNPSWVDSILIPSPILTNDQTWSHDPHRHLMREALAVDRDAIFADLFRKVAPHAPRSIP